MELRGLELIRDYRKNPGKYLPMKDFTEQVPGKSEDGGVNISWYAGLLEERRPFFAETWAVDQITMLTIYVSTEGIENITADELGQWFQDIGYIGFDDEIVKPTVRIIEDHKGNRFFSINICIGIDDDPPRVKGGAGWGWPILNRFNRENG